MSGLTQEEIDAWRNLGAAYVEHMPNGDAMFTALCDMAFESIALKRDAEAVIGVTRSFLHNSGKSTDTPTLTIYFRTDDWEARDRLSKAIDKARKP